MSLQHGQPHHWRAVHCIGVGLDARTACATDSGLQPPARHGQNDPAIVIGRRNWLFADTVAGANASANLYSVLQTCKVNGIDADDYLRKLLIALPVASTANDYDALLPWAIGAAKA